MKTLTKPTYDDHDILENLSLQDDVCSYPHLRYVLDNILEQYAAYETNEGNPWNIDRLGMINPLKDQLIYHYNNPTKVLSHIDNLRDEKSPDVCPMCGSSKTGTLDHVLPKAKFPEFSVFSKNLVPACDCNSLRDKAYMGTTTAQRAIHPYYDDFIGIRLMRAVFAGRLESPLISLVVCCGNIPQIEIVNFHLEKVVLKTRVIKFLEAKWAVMIRKPDSMLISLDVGMVTEDIVRTSAEMMLKFYDDQHGTPNNWFSFLYSGILNSVGVTTWLTNRINDIYRGDIIPD